MKRLFSIGAALLLGCSALFAQTKLTGTILDEGGLPLPGVMVVVVENGQDTPPTTRGDVSDIDGNYTIYVNKGETIEYTFLGYTKVSRVYNGEERLDIVLKEDQMFLEDAVIVGYGQQKKSSITSAVSAIKGDELLKAPATNVSQVLAGKLPGISSVQESGEPGLDQASLRIRGSVYGVSYVVDGFPVDNINDIDPSDIESISVLKDGASAAVYGLSAAGGVIIVTTKRGEKGDAKITYNASAGASMNANFPQFLDGVQFVKYYDIARYMDMRVTGYKDSKGNTIPVNSKEDYTPMFSEEIIELIENGDPSDGWDNVNYIDLVFGTGFNQKHNVTVQGGNDKTSYFVSGGILDQQGNIDNFSYNRYNVRANVESQIAKNLKFNFGLSGVMTERKSPAFLSGGADNGYYEAGWFSIARQTVQMHPYLPVQMDGHYTGAVQNNQGFLVSPLAAIYESGYKKTRTSEMDANASLVYNVPFIKGLSFKASGSFNYYTSYNKNLSLPYTMSQHKYDETTKQWSWVTRSDNPHISDNVSNLGEGVSFYQSMVGQLSANYANSFGKHNVDAMLLAEWRDYRSNGLSAYAKNIPFAELPELSYGQATNDPVGGWSDASRSEGYVFRVRYDYDEKYLAEVTGRYDGSYKFSGMDKKKRWGFFPSASLGWRLSKEEFMKDFEAVSDLKLRASVGLLGNDSVSPYMFMSSYDQSLNVVYPDGMYPSFSTSGIPNTDLTWEKTQSWNVGMDLQMWEGLFGMEVDVFYNYTYDMLSWQSSSYTPSMGGYYPSVINYNSIDAKGIDILFSHRNHVDIFGKPFWYDLTASLTYSHTRWLKYKDNSNIQDYQRVVGSTYGSIMCWKADGLFRSEEEIDNSAWYGTRPNLGDIKYVDINGDGVIDNEDRGYFGLSNRPRLTYGFNVNLAWGGFDFNAQFTGGSLFNVSLTGTYYNGYDDNTIWTQTFKEGGNSPLFLVENAYSEFNPDGTFPRITLSTVNHGGDNGLASTFWLRDGTYLRLKTAQLGYSLPKKLLSNIGISALRVFVEGQNLYTWDNLPEGVDPESPEVNNGYYPQQTLVMGGFTITF
ncbi:MAG: SusC/RagA family TonB-linked outer membrane protein [Candidatus Cryptobacteroides sp.]